MGRPVNILIIEDDPAIGELITFYTEKSGYHVSIAPNGKAGLNLFYEHPPDLIILDIMLPEMDGWDVCREIRRYGKIPIIMLTGKGESREKLKGFDLGADDYLVKPFDPHELMARIKAVLRRANPLFDADVTLEFPCLNIDLHHYQVICGTQQITLAPRELEVLYFLASHANRVFTRQQLLDHLWGFDFAGDPRTVDVHIKRIREKLGESNPFWRIKTIRGVGYKFEVERK
jgi:DNA-binding response OmpR family regulator